MTMSTLPFDPPAGVSRERRAPAWIGLLLGLAAAGFGLLGPACRSTTPAPRVEQVPAAASAALEEARTWMRGSGPGAVERARAAVRRARELAPDWIAPRRLEDDLMVADLLGIEALASHRRALDADPDDAAELYLAGRLEGALGRFRFERAARSVHADPVAMERDVQLEAGFEVGGGRFLVARAVWAEPVHQLVQVDALERFEK